MKDIATSMSSNVVQVANGSTEAVRVSVRSQDQEERSEQDQQPGQVLKHYTKGWTNSSTVHVQVTGMKSGKTASMTTESNRSVIITRDFKLKPARYKTMWQFGSSSIWEDEDGVNHQP